MKIELDGYDIDNLLKTLHFKKITLLNIQRIERKKVSFEIMDKDYKLVKRYIANFKVKQTLSKFKQIPQILLRYQDQRLLPACGVLFRHLMTLVLLLTDEVMLA